MMLRLLSASASASTSTAAEREEVAATEKRYQESIEKIRKGEPLK